MQKKLIAVAVAGALAAPLAFAQSNVTVYGIVDIGFQHNDIKQTGSKSFLASGQNDASRIGFKGEEDLGNGLKALFNYEAGISADTGAETNVGQFFARQAWAGLGGSFGTVTLGRQFAPQNTVDAWSEYNNGASFLTWLPIQTGRTTRFSNSAKYVSPEFSGFSGQALYSWGENTTTKNASNAWDLGAFYKGGPLKVGYSHQEQRNTTNTGKTKVDVLGGTGTFGMFSVYAGWTRAKGTAAVTTNTRTWTLGGSVRIGVGDIWLQHSSLKNKATTNSDAKLTGIAYYHPLSKRTKVYTSYARLTNESAATFNFNVGAAGAPAAGVDPKGFQVGFQHNF